MTEQAFFHDLIIAWFVVALIIFLALFYFVAPYGRHARRGWGPGINNKMGWLIMEAPAPLVFAACFLLGDNQNTIPLLFFLGLWEAHYVHRAFVYPFGLRSKRRMPVVVMASGFIFNGINGYINGRYLFTFANGYSSEWLADPRFIIGLLLFIIGYVINRRADYSLRNLRKTGESDYKICYGGMFRWISCPNYLGEITTWAGWAVATWSLPGLAFAFWTAANLMPRARAHHNWYRRHFPDYPSERKALVPRLW